MKLFVNALVDLYHDLFSCNTNCSKSHESHSCQSIVLRLSRFTSDMLCRKIKQFFSIKPSFRRHRVDYSRQDKLQQCHLTDFFTANPSGSMSSVYRFCSVRLWGLWTRGFLASSVVKRCRRERSVREVFQCFRQTFRPRRTLLISATAAYKRDGDAQAEPDESTRSISDEELTVSL